MSYAVKAAARFVVCTGGEPLLQLDPPLIDPLDLAHLAFRRFPFSRWTGPIAPAILRSLWPFCHAHPQWQSSLQTHKLIGFQ